MLSATTAALARLATNVAVVTTSDGATPHGVTANGWGESDEPPLLLVTLAVGSRTLPIVQRTGRFAVNVLADHQEGLARTFARREEQPGDRFTGVSYRMERDCPVLDDCLATLVCRVEAEAPFGGQRIVVGRIEHAESRAAEPLIFFDRAFRLLAPLTSSPRPVPVGDQAHNTEGVN